MAAAAPALLRPYLAVFAGRFLQMLQYRAAAIAGFATQCWWGATKIMIYAAFYATAPQAAGALSLPQVITYTWLAQALLVLAPWNGDPDVALAVRTGAVSFDRVRPVDAYAWRYAAAAAWITARAVPRAALMFALAGVALPLLGLGAWSWQAPADLSAAALFVPSLALAVALSSAFVMLINVCVVATLTDRGINTLMMPLAIIFTGNLLPLQLFPDWARTALFLQPFAGVFDIPFRIYFGQLAGASAALGLALQLGWTAVLAAAGWLWLQRVMRRLQVQGG